METKEQQALKTIREYFKQMKKDDMFYLKSDKDVDKMDLSELKKGLNRFSSLLNTYISDNNSFIKTICDIESENQLDKLNKQ